MEEKQDEVKQENKQATPITLIIMTILVIVSNAYRLVFLRPILTRLMESMNLKINLKSIIMLFELGLAQDFISFVLPFFLAFCYIVVCILILISCQWARYVFLGVFVADLIFNIYLAIIMGFWIPDIGFIISIFMVLYILRIKFSSKSA